MMTRFALLLLLLCLLSSSCRKKDDSGNIIYTIKKGKHVSGSRASCFRGQHIRFRAKFDDSAIYTNQNPDNQLDLNKLYGFSDCSAYHHHRNSARFTWRWYEEALEIHAYCYVKGEMQFEYVTTVDLNEFYDYEILAEGNEYIFICNEDTTTMARACSGKGGVKYRLFPYFGGDEKAPHDITILLKEY